MQMSRKNRDKKELKASLIGFGLTAAGLTMLMSGFGFVGFAIALGAAYVVGKTVGIMSSGLDTTTHNRGERNMPVETIQTTGDTLADQVITRGQEMLREVREANNAIPDPELTRQMYELEDKCVQIFRTVSEKPDKASQIRKFMNYYLPTTLKMLNSYRTMQERGVSQRDLANARVTLRRGMEMVLTACQKQLDNLYKDTMLDVSTDIDVLEQMLKRDGFTEGDLSEESISAAENARTAAAAQMGATGVPTLNANAGREDDEDFDSYYQLKGRI